MEMDHVHGAEENHEGHMMMPAKKTWKDFLPLIVIFITILVFTGARLALLGHWDAAYALRNFMAAFFLVFGGFKMLNWKGFAIAYTDYDVIAKKTIAYAYLYPLIELGLGFAYLFDFRTGLANIVTLVIMLIGSIGVLIALLKKEQIPCACLGVVFKIPMTWVTLLEDITMAGMAALMLLAR